MEQLREIEARLQEAPDKQVSLTDPDARSMATSGRSRGMVGYNVQTAVDTKHHLIVAHEVTNVGHDRCQLANMAKLARDAMAADELTAVADRGYFKSEEIRACHDAGITPYLPKSITSNANKEGRFDKADFIYDAEKNVYRCPAGEHLIWCFSRNPSLLELELPAVCAQEPMHTQHRKTREPLGA